MAKKRMSLSIGTEEAERLERLSGYASAITSELLRKFFARYTVEDVWTAMEMDKPMTEKERMISLRRLIKETFSGLSRQQKNPAKKKDYWEWS